MKDAYISNYNQGCLISMKDAYISQHNYGCSIIKKIIFQVKVERSNPVVFYYWIGVKSNECS